MKDVILSVKTDELLEQVWDIMTNKSSYFESKGKKLDEVIEIYNELCKCRKAIKGCNSESTYTQLVNRVGKCENAIKSFV